MRLSLNTKLTTYAQKKRYSSKTSTRGWDQCQNERMHAAMGLCLLGQFDDILAHRQALYNRYHSLLAEQVQTVKWHEGSAPNGSYFPILLNNEAELLALVDYLSEQQVQTRRYFYPSLSEVPAYGMRGETPIANDASRRVLCLPMYTELTLSGVEEIRYNQNVFNYREGTS